MNLALESDRSDWYWLRSNGRWTSAFLFDWLGMIPGWIDDNLKVPAGQSDLKVIIRECNWDSDWVPPNLMKSLLGKFFKIFNSEIHSFVLWDEEWAVKWPLIRGRRLLLLAAAAVAVLSSKFGCSLLLLLLLPLSHRVGGVMHLFQLLHCCCSSSSSWSGFVGRMEYTGTH